MMLKPFAIERPLMQRSMHSLRYRRASRPDESRGRAPFITAEEARKIFSGFLVLGPRARV
jgi:hypothetical protein